MKGNPVRFLLLLLALGLSALTSAQASNPNCPTALLCSTAQASCTKGYIQGGTMPPALCDDSLGNTWHLWHYSCTTPPSSGPCLTP
jgi:hypothetical protein